MKKLLNGLKQISPRVAILIALAVNTMIGTTVVGDQQRKKQEAELKINRKAAQKEARKKGSVTETPEGLANQQPLQHDVSSGTSDTAQIPEPATPSPTTGGQTSAQVTSLTAQVADLQSKLQQSEAAQETLKADLAKAQAGVRRLQNENEAQMSANLNLGSQVETSIKAASGRVPQPPTTPRPTTTAPRPQPGAKARWNASTKLSTELQGQLYRK